MKFYIIAGEASGDMHGAMLIRELKKSIPDAKFRCWGGEKMQAEGAEIVKHYKDLAFMGFAEVLMNIRTIKHNLDFCQKDILDHNPDILILIDYPGFNMRIAKFAHNKGIKVVYYIAPQVWAWKKNRIHKLHKNTDLCFALLPFEKEFHAARGYEIEYTGNPLLDTINNYRQNPKELSLTKSEKEIIALLPGSRKQEIKRILPQMLKVVDAFPEYRFVVAEAPSLPSEFYSSIIGNSDVESVVAETYPLLSVSRAALVTSGTATLETALFNVPQVVCYRMNLFSALVALAIVRVEFISLVNIILGRKAITELIQYKLNKSNLKQEVIKIVNDTPQRRKMLDDYSELCTLVGSGSPAAKAAEIIAAKFATKK